MCIWTYSSMVWFQTVIKLHRTKMIDYYIISEKHVLHIRVRKSFISPVRIVYNTLFKQTQQE